MDRLTTNQPDTNYLTLMNFAFCGDDGATVLRFAGKPIVRLDDYMSEQCQKCGCDCDKVSAEIEDGFMGCSDCPLGILYYCAVQGAELRDRLMEYENTGISPEYVKLAINHIEEVNKWLGMMSAQLKELKEMLRKDGDNR